MREFIAYRRAAIRHWERRRFIYNLALILPSSFSYLFAAGLMSVGDPSVSHPYFALSLFAVAAIGANLCYSFVYVLEFLFGSDDAASRWLRVGRRTTFAAGLVIAIVFALIGGRNIAVAEFYSH